MKRIFFLILILSNIISGQDYNSVKVTRYKVDTEQSILNPDVSIANQSKVFLDGQGKQIQFIFHKMSSNGNDIILPITYDALGRRDKSYLPYSNSSPSLNFNPNAISEQINYPDYQGEVSFSQSVYQNSTNYLLKKASVGNDWALNSGHELKFEYKTNIANEVKLFIALSTWNSTLELYDISLNESGSNYYNANTLHKYITKNENWVSGVNNTSEQFYNKEGQLILKRVYDNSLPHDTYYVYDQFGNLTYIIPPKADGVLSNSVINELCFQYVYDYKNRLVEKKLPGKEWEYLVYDKLDRVVMTGPSSPPFLNLTNNGWMIYKYDVFNRNVIKGWMTSSTITRQTRKSRQDERNATTTPLNENRLTATNATPAGIGNSNNPSYSYSNLSLPISNYYILSVDYYDNYDYVNPPTIPTIVEGQNVFYNNTNRPYGLLTGRWVKMIQNSTSASSRRELKYIFYDEKSRPIRNFTRNHQLGGGGFTQIDLKYDYEGKILFSTVFHKRIESETPGVTIKNFYNYSNQGRLINHSQQVNTNPIQLIAQYQYDALGKIISKKVGNTEQDPLQKIDFSYNIKGWLTGINDVSNLSLNNDPIDLFAFKINYNTTEEDLNTPEVSKLYNGNISETYWKTATDNVLRKYAFSYDNLNRLKNAYYILPNSTTPNIKSYNEALTYDKNGNILTLFRNGGIEGLVPALEIDELNYTYENNSNKLIKITDASTVTSGFNDGANTSNEYLYDAYGNLIKDDNKGITSIKYNHLDLPIRITFGNLGTIEYIYNAEGIKLEKIVTQGTTVTTTKYLQGFEYVNDILQFFPHPEGYVAREGNSFRYIFQYKDHLGNIRLSYTKNQNTGNLDIIEENHFYPFGLKHDGYNNVLLPGGNAQAQKYKFQEQERQNELGLNWDSFKWRNYDAAIGRFISVDPLAEKYSKWTPYAFSGNQVVHSRELEGLEPENDLDYDNDYYGISHPMQDEFQTGGPYIDGSVLNEVVVTPSDFNRADESYGYDNGRYENPEDFDNDIDGDSIEDRENAERALEEMADSFQDIGTFISFVGLGLTLFGVTAPVGAALMALGSGLSWGGIAIEFAEDAFDGHDGMDWGNHLMNIGSELIPGYYDEYFGSGSDDFVKGVDNLMIELGAAGSDLWMDTISDLHKNK